jgi:transcriptional regulator with XRE-family HTH domain
VQLGSSRRDPATTIPKCRRAIAEIDLHVGVRIQTRREQLGVSLGELARAVGISARTLRAHEAGAARLIPAELGAIATALAVGISYFFDDSEPTAGQT